MECTWIVEDDLGAGHAKAALDGKAGLALGYLPTRDECQEIERGCTRVAVRRVLVRV